MPEFYFSRYEDRKPPEPVPYSASGESVWQFFATLNICLGGWYLWWRWNYSINYDALWFSLPLVIAETCAYVGLLLFTFNLWKIQDYPQTPPPAAPECLHKPDRFLPDKITVDVFLPTYDEDPELVRLSLLDAKRITYPHPVDIRIHVLDDGRRAEMRRVALEENVNYIARENNIGFKAGNLQNAMKRTQGEFILICDADTRPFPTILEHTMGYFRDPQVAWVQTPQWFYDIPEGKPLPEFLRKYLNGPGCRIGRAIEKVFGPVYVGKDPFSNDPQMFYDVIQRRRNRANAAFCCGAASIHRREAVQLMALRNRGVELEGLYERLTSAEEDMILHLNRIEKRFVNAGYGLNDKEYKKKFTQEMRDVFQNIRKNVRKTIRKNANTVNMFFLANPVPYKHHVSEDMYTSLILHSEVADIDPGKKWKSVLHPGIESRMLSTQDLLSWTIQRFKYAGGTLDIAWREKHLFFKKGLSPAQKLMYGATFWSYFGCLWNLVFLLSPIIYLFTGIPPVEVYSTDFFKHFFPFIIANTLAMMTGTWGVPSWSGQSTYISFFWINIKAMFTVMGREKRRFPRIRTRLPGICTINGRSMDVTIRDISHFNFFDMSGLKVELLEMPAGEPVHVGDELDLKFCFNDEKQSCFQEKVFVRRIRGRELGVEIQKNYEEKIKFRVTPKIRQEKVFVRLVIPQLVIISLTLLGLIYGIIMYYIGHRADTVALIANMFWGFFNIAALSGLVRAAFWQPEKTGDNSCPATNISES